MIITFQFTTETKQIPMLYWIHYTLIVYKFLLHKYETTIFHFMCKYLFYSYFVFNNRISCKQSLRTKQLFCNI